ncbi:hypothetical protein PRK78_007460 [Emydomyces testavorans]|uniref:Caspase domain-containing protein n=1 Tax=Emydomyces testavorans TaxID=2070801 RepID=A0AAF0ILF8_9EURO|nr:hypothetical protein PRK78_007460 [Emydomyces testavorans]
MTAITKQELKETLETAIERRSCNYVNSYAISFCWQTDNTNAEDDVDHFQSFLITLGLHTAEECVILEDDKTPAWTVADKLVAIMKNAHSSPGASIVFVHYAGHGMKDEFGELVFTSGSGQSFRVYAAFFHLSVNTSPYLDDASEVDMVFIFDSFGCATQELTPRKRVVEVLAAMDVQDATVSAPTDRRSVTAKLAGEVTRRKRAGAEFVELAEVIATLRAISPQEKPTHTVALGGQSICLPLRTNRSGRPANTLSTWTPKLTAVFSVHIFDQFSQDDIDELIAWIRQLSRKTSIQLVRLYETNSMCLIFEADYAIYTKLAGLRGIGLICETTNGNLLHQDQTPLHNSDLSSDEKAL